MTQDSTALTSLIGAVVGACAAFSAFAAERHLCSTVVDSAARLACYDAVFGAPAAMPTPAPDRAGATRVAPVPVAGTAAATETTAVHADLAAAFGSEQVKRPKTTSAPEPAESITSTVRSVSRRPYGELVVELENGQTWVQQEADSSVRIKPGDAVVIKRAALGSYRLRSRHESTRVRRER